jgi:hypothetical protein
MASTLRSTHADARVDGGVAPTVAKDRFTDVGEALAGLMHATCTPDARARGPGDRSDDARISQSFAAPALGAADLGPRIPREQRSLGKRGALARVAIVVCLGASAIWAWRSYGGPASQAASIAQPANTAANEQRATSAERQQIETTACNLAALRQTVEQLAAGQKQLTRDIAKLQAERPQADNPKSEKRMLRRMSAPGRGSDVFDPTQNPNAPGVPHALGSIVLRRGSPRRHPSRSRQRRWRRKVASQVSTVSSLLPQPQPTP